MQEVDDKIFSAVEKLKELGLLESMIQLYEVMEIKKQNYYAIRRSKNLHFTVAQIARFIKAYNINPNFIFSNNAKLFEKLT